MSKLDITVKDLKYMLEHLPEEMKVIIPVIDEDDANRIYGFRKVRTAGVLICEDEEDQKVFCLNASWKNQDLADQVIFSGRDAGVETVWSPKWLSKEATDVK